MRHRVFISYSRADFYFAEQLAAALTRRGLAVWLDVHELAMGSDWSAAIDRAIAECDTYLLVASREAEASPSVRAERDRAAELARPSVAVLARRAIPPAAAAMPAYDLRGSFTRGADRLAGDLIAGRATGWRPRVRLPYPWAVCLASLALALYVVFAVVLGSLLLREVDQHGTGAVTAGETQVAIVVWGVAFTGCWSAGILWGLLTRRVTWLYLRGWLFAMPVVALVTWVTVDTLAGRLAQDPLLAGLVDTSEQTHLGDAAGLLAIVSALLGAAAAVATEWSAGLYRHLRTGTAPRRVRARHVGGAAPHAGRPGVAHSYRLLSTESDAQVADEVRSCLRDAGISEAADGLPADRDVVVLSDRTPAEWLSREDLRDPVGIAATSIRLPVRGVLQRFQWVDYRARRSGTLARLGRELRGAEGSSAEPRPIPDVPEGLELPRLPRAVMIVEWTLYCVAALAMGVAAYTAVSVGVRDGESLSWVSVLCAAVAPAPVLLALWLRRRLLTPWRLAAALAACWLAMIALGLDTVLQAWFPDYDRGPISALTVIYPAISGVVVALAWRSLRRWLPRRAPIHRPAGATLGSVRGSWGWLVILLGVLSSAVGAAVINTTDAQQAGAIPAVSDLCRDRAEIIALGAPLVPVNEATYAATRRKGRAAFEERVRVATDVRDDLERLEPRSAWGASIRDRLVPALERSIRADQGYLDGTLTRPRWAAEYGDLGAVGGELGTPVC